MFRTVSDFSESQITEVQGWDTSKSVKVSEIEFRRTLTIDDTEFTDE